MIGDYKDRKRRAAQLAESHATKIRDQLKHRLAKVEQRDVAIGIARQSQGHVVEKVMRETCPEYLAWIRTLPCVMTGTHPVDPAHLITVGSGGSDFTAIPLRHDLHMEQHACGFFTFMEKRRIDLWPFAISFVDMWVSMGNSGPRESVELIAERWYVKHGILYA